jgi:hypothetical protein
VANQYSKPRFVDETHKECSWCSEIKLHSEFHKDKNAPSGCAYYCRECANAKTRSHHAKEMSLDSEQYQRRKKDSWVRNKYGITLEEYEQKLVKQGSSCKVCKIPLIPKGQHTHLDHNHSTGKLRDFLCTNCNRGLGHFQDREDLLFQAMCYLEDHR